jgi:hypothetical protein
LSGRLVSALDADVGAGHRARRYAGLKFSATPLMQ